MRLVPALLFALAALPIGAGPVSAQEVDVELVFLADSSGSIDAGETAFQRGGHAEALAHPDVVSAIRKGIYGRVAVTYVEWGNAARRQRQASGLAIAVREAEITWITVIASQNDRCSVRADRGIVSDDETAILDDDIHIRRGCISCQRT
jgi:hypothetical protein